MKRYYRGTVTERWYEGWKQREGLPFNDDGEDDASRIALIAGEPIEPVTVDDDSPDPRDGNRFADPPQPPKPPGPPTLEERIAILEARLAALERI